MWALHLQIKKSQVDAQILALGAQFLSYMTEKYKQKLQITLVTVKDCGNHAAIDHFANPDHINNKTIKRSS